MLPILIKVGYSHVLHKFAKKYCKRSPPHLNSVYTLPCKTWSRFLWKFLCCETATLPQ